MNREEGTTIFLTSHDAGDVEKLCDRAIVINHGGIVFDGQVEFMKRQFLTHKTVQLVLENDPGKLSLDGVAILTRGGSRLTLSVDTGHTTIESVMSALMASHRIVDMTVQDPPMEDIISRMYGTFRTKEAVM